MVVVFLPPSSATRSMYRGEPSPLGSGTNRLEQAGRMDPPHGQRPVGVGRIDHPRLVDVGKNARTANARRPDWSTSCGPSSSNGFSCLSFNQLTDRFQGHRRSHANLHAGTEVRERDIGTDQSLKRP